MTSEEEHYYQEMFATMATEGWKYLLEDLKQHKEELTIRIMKSELSEKDYQFLRGIVAGIDNLLNMKTLFENVYEDLKKAH